MSRAVARSAAIDLAARLDITYQQALGGLVLLGDLDESVTTEVLHFHLQSAFGLVTEDHLPMVVERLSLAGILRECEQPGWWEVLLP